jgi:ADP-ribose pyrophosphatase YjhB (NUDIX family)
MAHIHELYDFTIAAVIVHDGKALLVKHPRYGKWLCPGGHVELNEDPEEALNREVEEETGLKATLLKPKPDIQTAGAKVLPLPNYMDVHEANAPHKHISLVYYMRADSSDAKLSDEHEELRWVGKDELDSAGLNLQPEIRQNIAEAIDLAAAEVP